MNAREPSEVPQGALPRARIFFVAMHGLLAVLIPCALSGLPTRNMPVDVGGGILAVLSLGSGLVLLLRERRLYPLVSATCVLALLLGMVAISLLLSSVAFLAGVHGSVGRGGVVLATLVLALLFPYLIVYPALELLWLRGARDLPAPRRPASHPVGE